MFRAELRLRRFTEGPKQADTACKKQKNCITFELINNAMQTGNQKEGKNYYPALTGIRAVAAWMVFVHHFNVFSEARAGRPAFLFFSEMHTGVTVFFVLSGLLITLRYYDQEINKPLSFYNYMVKRFSRIFPVFFLIVLLNFIWLLGTGVYSNSFSGGWKYFLGTVTLLRGFFAETAVLSGNLLVPQSWSLTVEECFYILCPLIFLLLRKNIRALFLIPVLLTGAGLLLTLFFTRFPFHHLLESFRFLFNFTFFGRCTEFFAGIGVGFLFKKLQPQKTKGFAYTFSGAAVMIACIAGLALFHTDEHYGDYYTGGIIINNLVLPVAGIAVFFWGLMTERNWLTVFLSGSVMTLFGKSSYIFYLIHLGVFAVLLHNHLAGKPLLYFACLNAIAVGLYLGFEKPVNNMLRKKLLIRNKQPDATDMRLSN